MYLPCSGGGVVQPIVRTCLQLGLNPNLARMVESDGSSRFFLASKLVRFNKERASSNVNSVKQKKCLDPNKINLVKSITFPFNSLNPLSLSNYLKICTFCCAADNSSVDEV